MKMNKLGQHYDKTEWLCILADNEIGMQLPNKL